MDNSKVEIIFSSPNVVPGQPRFATIKEGVIVPDDKDKPYDWALYIDINSPRDTYKVYDPKGILASGDYELFLDDERDPPTNGKNLIDTRSIRTATAVVEAIGVVPRKMYLDYFLNKNIPDITVERFLYNLYRAICYDEVKFAYKNEKGFLTAQVDIITASDEGRKKILSTLGSIMSKEFKGVVPAKKDKRHLYTWTARV